MFKKINILPRWIIFFLDLSVGMIAYAIAYLIFNNFSIDQLILIDFFQHLPIFLFINFLVFYRLKTYAGIVRYSGAQDVHRLALAIALSSSFLFFTSKLDDFFNWNLFIYPLQTLIIYSVFNFLLLISYRFLIKYLFIVLQANKSVSKNVIIYGAGQAGLTTSKIFLDNPKNEYNILAFIDDDPKKVNKKINGITIFSSTMFADLVQKNAVDELIIAAFNLSPLKRNSIVEQCLEFGIQVKIVPPLNTWINGQFSSRQLQNFKIEQLLERDTIQLNNQLLSKQIFGKSILVTGAAGSIGSEIVRQLISYAPKTIILVDQAETPLHNLELELNQNKQSIDFVFHIADIRHEKRMEEIFEQARPDYVYHAAAYKHVPMMERSPAEAVITNVKGTQIVANLAVKFNAERFVLVSTDKAVNPTNIMGASKRLAEMYIQWLCQQQDIATKFITTRFGNVLGSNGSVVHRFKDQIENGGPVTVTHPEITRYFMTIPEACQLVLEAASMGQGGEIFVFDMGEPIRVVDLARKMIQLYGLNPGKDIEIEYTGLRPGEKLYEELLNESENTVPTHHHKIMIAKVSSTYLESMDAHFEDLISLAYNSNAQMVMVAKVKALVPEFVSNNSVFEELDQ